MWRNKWESKTFRKFGVFRQYNDETSPAPNFLPRKGLSSLFLSFYLLKRYGRNNNLFESNKSKKT